MSRKKTNYSTYESQRVKALKRYWKQIKHAFEYKDANHSIHQYKRCGRYLLQLSFVKGLSECNQDRDGIRDLRFAKIRASHMYCDKIYDPLKKQWIKRLHHDSGFSHYQKIIYKEGYLMVPHEYDKNIEEICAGGIHFFFSLEAAFLYGTRYAFGDQGEMEVLTREVYNDIFGMDVVKKDAKKAMRKICFDICLVCITILLVCAMIFVWILSRVRYA